MNKQLGAGPRQKAGRAAAAVLLFWMLAWPVLAGSYTPQAVGIGASIAVNLLLVSCLGLIYRPDRGRGFAILAASLTLCCLLGLLAVLFLGGAFLTFVTTPRTP